MASLVCTDLHPLLPTANTQLHRIHAGFGSSTRTSLPLPRQQVCAQASSIGKESSSSKGVEPPVTSAAANPDPVSRAAAPGDFAATPIHQIISTRLSELNKFLFSTRLSELHKFLFSKRKKGDLSDVVLMSISMAVFVYISQQLVCIYCLLRHHSLDF